MSRPPNQAGENDAPNGADDARAEELALWIERHGPALKRYFARKIGPADAEDLVQEVFLRLQQRGRGEPIANVERYLFTMAKHVLLNRSRHDRTDGMWWHAPLDTPGAAADDISPERILVAKQDMERAIVAILNLPPRTRMAFEYHRFEKLSYAAIAERMGISKAAVQGLMERAIARLADEFESELFGDEP